MGIRSNHRRSCASNNYAKFTVKHVCWTLFLIKLQAVMMRNFIKIKTLAQVLSYFVEHVRTDGWVIWTKKSAFTKSIFRKTLAMVSFLIHLLTCRLTVFQNGFHHRCFFMKIVKFYRTPILQNNAARLLMMISCDISDVSITLSVINQFSHSMEI